MQRIAGQLAVNHLHAGKLNHAVGRVIEKAGGFGIYKNLAFAHKTVLFSLPESY